MDKYEYKLRLEQIRNYYKEEKYKEAARVADTIDWRKVKDWSTLAMIINIYDATGQIDDAKNVSIIAYNKKLGGRRLVYKLAELLIRLNELDDAQEVYDEFVKMAPNDISRYTLLYRLSVAKGASLDKLISILKEYKELDKDETCLYELACLYEQSGQIAKCMEECDELIIWFNGGDYFEDALRLKKRYDALTHNQKMMLERLDSLREASVEQKSKTVTIELPKGVLNASDIIKAVTGQINTTEVKEELDKPLSEHIRPVDVKKLNSSDSDTETKVIDVKPKDKKELENLESSFTGVIGINDSFAPVKEIKEVVEEEPVETSEAVEASEEVQMEEAPNSVLEEEARYIAQEPVTSGSQQTNLNNTVKIPIPDYSLYDTVNIQKEIAESIRPYIDNYDEESLKEATPKKEAEVEKPSVVNVNSSQPDMFRVVDNTSRIIMPGPNFMIGDKDTQVIEALKEGLLSGEIVLPPTYEEENNAEVAESIEPHTPIDVFSKDIFKEGDTKEIPELDMTATKEIKPVEEAVEESVVAEVQQSEAVEQPVEAVEQELEVGPTGATEERLEEVITEEAEQASEEVTTEEVVEASEEVTAEEVVEASGEVTTEEAEQASEEVTAEEVVEVSGEVTAEEVVEASEEVQKQLAEEPTLEMLIRTVDQDNEQKMMEEATEDIDEEAAEVLRLSQEVKAVTVELEKEELEKSIQEAEADAEAERTVKALAAALSVDIAEAKAKKEAEQALAEAAVSEEAKEKETESAEEPEAFDLTFTKDITAEIEASLSKVDSSKAITAMFPVIELEDEEEKPDNERTYSASYEKLFADCFSNYVNLKGMKAQVHRALENIKSNRSDGTSKKGNLIVTGNKSLNKLDLAIAFVKALNMINPNNKRKIAKTTAESLNKKGLANVLNKLFGAALIVENAASLSGEMVVELEQVMSKDTKGMMVILIDTESSIIKFLGNNPRFTAYFDNLIEIRRYNVNELVDIAKDYAQKKNCTISDKALLKLYLVIDKLNTSKDNADVQMAKRVIDEAIERAKERVSRGILGIIKKKPGKELVLKESDIAIESSSEESAEEEKDE